MATDAKGNNHKAAGRPDGGQFDRKTGQGSDDDLVEVPTTADSVAPDEGWWASLENDPEAAAGPEASREPAAKTGGDVESEDRPWWIVPGDDAPEVRKVGRIIVNAPSREAARALLMGVSEDFRCAVIRFLPFEYKAALIDLTPNPDERNDIFSLLEGLPYSADDAKAGRLRDLVAKGDVRATVALAVHGDDKDREWITSLPVERRPVVWATLKLREEWPEKRKAGVGVPTPKKMDTAKAPTPETKDVKTEKPTPKEPKPADPVADTLKELEGVGDVMKARAIITCQPRGVRVAVIRAQPFDRITALADLTGDPDKARGYQSLLDMLPYTKDSPADRLRDMASRGDVRAAAALAAYGDDDARRWLSTLPVGDHRAVQLALRAWAPPGGPAPPPPPAAAPPAPPPPGHFGGCGGGGPGGPPPPPTGGGAPPPAPKPAGRAKGGAVASKPASKPEDKAEGKAMASKPAERDAGVRSFRSGWSTARHPARKPRKPPFRERMRGGLRQLRTIWSGVWTKWLAVFRR